MAGLGDFLEVLSGDALVERGVTAGRYAGGSVGALAGYALAPRRRGVVYGLVGGVAGAIAGGAAAGALVALADPLALVRQAGGLLTSDAPTAPVETAGVR